MIGAAEGPDVVCSPFGENQGMARTAYLNIVSDREAIHWILSRQSTAFGSGRLAAGRALEPGDRLFIYATRGAWRNPTRHRGRVIAVAEVAAEPRALEAPLMVAGREFVLEVPLRIDRVAPYPSGVVLADQVDEMDLFPNKRAWSARLRTSLLRLTPHDVSILDRELRPLLQPLESELPAYGRAAKLLE
jgi:hypothetical protein